MKTLEETTIDKCPWPRGEWDREPDKMQWRDEATGLPCLIVRSPSSGGLCGYVGVSKGHPWFEKDYNDVDPQPDVHGGLTFSNQCSGRICHAVEAGEDDKVWWLGFDHGHDGDLSPAFEVRYPGHGGTYRTLGYVKRECANLARQAKAAEVTQ